MISATHFLSSSIRVALAAACLLCVPAVQAQHRPLLPEPVKIAYGTHAFALCHAEIVLKTSPAAHATDEFAAHQLAGICSTALPVRNEEDARTTSDTPRILLANDNHAAETESYRIAVNSNSAELHASSSAGLFYGVQTLLQLVERPKDSAPLLPEVSIEDHPAMRYRGLMLDTSHGAMPTLESLHALLDHMAAWKLNQFYFYAETNLPLHDPAPRDAGNQWTRAEIADLIAYAAQRHIDVVPCVEFYGHLHDLLAMEQYAAMGAMPHGGELNPNSPDARRLVESWMRQIAQLFPSPWIHIGFDEPFELDHLSAEARNGIAPDVLWAEHLRRTAELAQTLGKRPIFWADIDEGAFLFNKYPQLASSLPPGAVAAPWFYDARADYSSLLAPFRQNKVPILAASAVSDWDDIVPDYATSFTNINGMAQAARDDNALGLINTIWSDSALPLHRAALPGIAFGAAAAWQSSRVDEQTFFGRYVQFTLPDASPAAAEVYRNLEQVETLLKASLGSEPAFRAFDDPFGTAFLTHARNAQPQLRQIRRLVERAEEDMGQLRGQGIEDDSFRTLAALADIVYYSATRALYAVEIEDNFRALPERPSPDDLQFLLSRETAARNHSRVQDLIDQAGQCMEEYRAMWLSEYRPFRLATAMGRWQREQQFWIGFQENIWRVRHEFKSGDPKPTLAQILAETR